MTPNVVLWIYIGFLLVGKYTLPGLRKSLKSSPVPAPTSRISRALASGNISRIGSAIGLMTGLHRRE